MTRYKAQIHQMEERRGTSRNIAIEVFSEGICSEFGKPGVVSIKCVQDGIGE